MSETSHIIVQFLSEINHNFSSFSCFFHGVRYNQVYGPYQGDKQAAAQEYLGCHPCINTTSLRIPTKDILNTFLSPM